MATQTIKNIKFLKIRDVKSPSRAYKFDAGIDFYVPAFNKLFIKDLKEKNSKIFNDDTENLIHDTSFLCIASNSTAGTALNQPGVNYELGDTNKSIFRLDDETGENYFLLPPHSRIMIPSGIKSRMAEPGRALIAGNKSGIATKHGLVFGAQVVDYTYKGEIHLSLINTSTKSVRIYENMKILQFLETPIFYSLVEVEEPTPSPDINIPWDLAEEKFYKGLQDDRGSDGFGSTDKK